MDGIDGPNKLTTQQKEQELYIVGKSLQNLKTNKLIPWYYFPWWEHDPNAMNVDVLSMEERRRLMKEGKCFQCKKSRHLAKDCPNKEDWDDKKRENSKKKWEGKKLYSFIRNIYQEMDNNKKEEFMKQAKEAGF